MEGREVSPGVILAGDQPLPADTEIDGAAWIGRDVSIGEGVRLMGPLVLGQGVKIGAHAQLRESILLPGTEIAAGSIVIGAIAGHSGILQSMRRRQRRRPLRRRGRCPAGLTQPPARRADSAPCAAARALTR